MPDFQANLVFECFIEGIPTAQPRPKARAIVINGKAQVRMYTPSSADAWKQSVARAVSHYVKSNPIDEPIRVDVTYFLPRPQSLMRKADPDGPILHARKPDVDNLDKATFDAMTGVGLIRDDSIICGGDRWKYTAAKGGKTGARLKVSRLVNRESEEGHEDHG